jgi:hypothetical protein
VIALARIRPLAEIEREVIATAVACIPDKLEAARRLGIGKTTLYRKLKELDIVATPLLQSEVLRDLTPLQQSQALRFAPTPHAVPEPKPRPKFLFIPSTKEEDARAHLRCPRCRSILLLDEALVEG